MAGVTETSETRACPFCAEEIRAAAILCKHCGRDVPTWRAPAAPSATPTPSADGRRAAPGRRSPGWWLAAGAAGLGLWVVGTRGGIFPAIGPIVGAPTTIRIAHETALEIPAGRAHSWGFELRDRRACRLTGHLAGVAGGRKDVKVFVLTADDYANWQQGLKVTPVWSGGQAAARSLDAVLPGPGAYRLVLDNSFSVFTGKVVRVDDARVTCG